MDKSFVLLRGGGDLASGVALRLHRAGIRVLITELAEPLVVRRSVAFAQAVFADICEVEGIVARKVKDVDEIGACFNADEIPVLVDPNLDVLNILKPAAIVDARMTKSSPETDLHIAPLVVGLGPGFEAGLNCHTVIETMRGHHLGRVYWQGGARADTGVPGSIAKHSVDRVLRAPAAGKVQPSVDIGQRVKVGATIAEVDGQAVVAAFDGVLRGLIHPSVQVKAGTKIGDLDPRNEPDYVNQVSDKSLAIGGGVLEALITEPGIRKALICD